MPEPDAMVRPGATVLIIDDSPENRYVVRRTLTRAGMTVLEAGTGAEGLALAAQLPDLVVCDVNLPDTTGFDICRQIKTDPQTAHTPVIHLSQSAVDDGSRVRGLEGGADAYLTDPIHGSVLVATVRALLRMRAAEDQLRQAADDALRQGSLNSELAAAQTELDVVVALLTVMNDPFVVWRAFLYPARPWSARPKFVFPLEVEPPDVALPFTLGELAELVAEVLAAPRHQDRVFYDAGRDHDLIVLPLIGYGQDMGTLLIELAEGITLPDRLRGRLATATERTAQTMERARLFEQQRAIAFELQSNLLPDMLPMLPGVELAADYRAGAEQMVVGGDFYDVFPGAAGWTAIIGDVAGRGASAAARTSLARHTAREAARHNDDPGSILMALNRAIDADKRRDQLDLITAICLRLSPGERGITISWAIAGHPLPVLLRADGTASAIGAPQPILGIDPSTAYASAECLLAPGDALFLYTDGLTESRRSGVLFGEQRLMDLLGEMVAAGAPVHELATEPIRAAAAYNERHDDDMASLVIRAAPLA